MVISTKMIYLILIFSLPILPPVLVQSALLFPFLNYIIKLYCFQYTSLYLHNSLHIPQNLRIRSEGTERHSALN